MPTSTTAVFNKISKAQCIMHFTGGSLYILLRCATPLLVCIRLLATVFCEP